MMAEVTITQILDDLRVADEITRAFERRYWLSSADFYALYSQGLLDDGEHTDDFAEWSAYYQVKLDREAIFRVLYANTPASCPHHHVARSRDPQPLAGCVLPVGFAGRAAR
jgi:hypothetical protein